MNDRLDRTTDCYVPPEAPRSALPGLALELGPPVLVMAAALAWALAQGLTLGSPLPIVAASAASGFGLGWCTRSILLHALALR